MNRFTPDQVREYKFAFRHFDRQKRGYIKSTELRDMLKTIGYNPTEKDLEAAVYVIDADKNGRIDFHEFMSLIDKLESEEKNAKEARIAYNAFDFLEEGCINAKDLKEALRSSLVIESASERDKQAVIRHFGLEKNRKIMFEEFKDMIITKEYCD